jgi:hypothetical protein
MVLTTTLPVHKAKAAQLIFNRIRSGTIHIYAYNTFGRSFQWYLHTSRSQQRRRRLGICPPDVWGDEGRIDHCRIKSTQHLLGHVLWSVKIVHHVHAAIGSRGSEAWCVDVKGGAAGKQRGRRRNRLVHSWGADKSNPGCACVLELLNDGLYRVLGVPVLVEVGILFAGLALLGEILALCGEAVEATKVEGFEGPAVGGRL